MDQLPTEETLTVEFKSDRGDGLPDRDLVEAIVCTANAEGGTIYLGIEKDGTVSGLAKRHRSVAGFPALVANHTVPPVHVTAELVTSGGKSVAVITVPASHAIVTTTDGRSVRRRLNHAGEPECVPFLPREFAARLAHFGEFDFSAETVPDLGPEAFDPVERARLRRAIETNALADKTLLKLSDDELDGALGLVKIEKGHRRATYAGVLVIGREALLRECIPNHEVAFQAFKGTQVTSNEFYRLPLIRLQEQLDSYYKAHVVEQEVQVGMFRVAVPNVDAQAYREAVVNALTHRDYTARGQIYIQWRDETLTVSSPGGLLEGVTPDNILTVPPRPRNPVLASIFKRAGLAERTGRGVDLIYEGLVKFGRPAPSYRQSTSEFVTVSMNVRPADLKFVELVTTEQNKRGQALPLNALLVLHALVELRRGSAGEIGDTVRVLDHGIVRNQLELLVEAGLVQAHGVKKGRTYTLSAQLYRRMGRAVDHIRQAGFEVEQQRQMVLSYVREHGSMKRADVMELCRLGEDQAGRLLAKLTRSGDLVAHGTKKGRRYEPR